MTDIILSTQNGEPVASSRDVAKRFGKRHDHVIRDIEELIKGFPKNGDTPMFFKTEYSHPQNHQKYPMYLMNRDGFSMLAMGFTGKEAVQWKLKYIEAFNQMEKQLSAQHKSQRAMQDKPLTTVPDEMRPTFDYSGLTDQTVEDLHFAEDEYRHGKQMAERGLVHMGNAIAAAHDALCGVVQLLDNSKHGNRGDDSFRAWCCSIGITKSTAYNLLQVSALMDGSSPRQQAILEALPPTLLYAVAKPSAPQELVEKVKNGEVTTNKAYQDLLKENQQLRTERDKARADQLSTAKDCNRLGLKASQEKDRADKAEAREEEAWKMQSKAETRAQEAEKQLEGSRQMAEAAKLRGDKLKAENDALKKQPITAVVDEEEVDRRAGEKAYQMAAEMTADLRAQLEQTASGSEQDAHSSYDNVLLADRSFQNIGKMVVPSLRRLPPEQREQLTNMLIHTLGQIQGEVSRCL